MKNSTPLFTIFLSQKCWFQDLVLGGVFSLWYNSYVTHHNGTRFFMNLRYILLTLVCRLIGIDIHPHDRLKVLNKRTFWNRNHIDEQKLWCILERLWPYFVCFRKQICPCHEILSKSSPLSVRKHLGIFKVLWLKQGCRPWGCRGHPQILCRSVNPISTRRDRLCPPNHYWHPRIFRPSDGPVKCSTDKTRDFNYIVKAHLKEIER